MENEREGNINVWLPITYFPQGTWSTTQACALTENRTIYPLVHRQALNPLSHSSQGKSPHSYKISVIVYTTHLTRE